jgi:cell division septation protein DedD
MSTLSPTLVEMLIGAIPPQDGAALVARVGERARMTSSLGTVEVGSAALTAEVFEGLSRRLLPQEQLETLQQTGSVEGQFVAPNGAGEFAVAASSTQDGQWIEVRRLGTTADTPHDAASAPVAPSVDTMVADLMSRTRSKSAASTTSPKVAIPSAPAPESFSASIPLETETPPAPIASAPVAPPAPIVTPDLNLASSDDSNDDLTVPTNFDFAQAKFDPDDLSVSETLVGDGAAPASGATQNRAAGTKNTKVTPPPKGGRTFADRLSAYGRLSILLPAAILLGIGLPVAGWFSWTSYFPTAKAPVAAPKAIAKPTAPAVANAPQATGGAALLVAHSKMPRVPMHAPSIRPSAPISSIAAAETAAVMAPPVKEQRPASVATPSVDHARSGFSVQVAAVRERDEANRMVAKLAQQGYAGYVVNGDGAAAGYYRVRIGTFPNHDAAEAIARSIEQREGTTPWIVKETR